MKIAKKIMQNNEEIKLDASNIAYKDLQGISRMLEYGIIVESDSNSDGHYVRYGDGTQICHRTITSSEATSYSYVEQGINFKGWAFTWKFPKPFKGGGDYSIFGTALLTGTTRRNMSINLESGLLYDRVPLRFETFVQAGSGFHALVTAIGRWK